MRLFKQSEIYTLVNSQYFQEVKFQKSLLSYDVLERSPYENQKYFTATIFSGPNAGGFCTKLRPEPGYEYPPRDGQTITLTCE